VSSSLALPAVDVPTLERFDAGAAAASLASAAQATSPNEPAGDVARGSKSGVPAETLTGGSDSPVRDRTEDPAPTSTPPAGTAGGTTKRGRGRPKGAKTAVTGPRYEEQKASELRKERDKLKETAAVQAAELERLRLQAAAAADETLPDFIGECCDAVFNLAASQWGEHMKIEPEQKTRLGELGARAARIHFPQVVQHSPLGAFLVAVGGLGLAKVATHKMLVAAAGGDAERVRNAKPNQ
jgi:hypothetical protein